MNTCRAQEPQDVDDRRDRLNKRLREAFIEGAEEDSRQRLGRGLTAEELERVLWRYPGDLTARQLSDDGPRKARPDDQ